jgi:hypothetical protein
MDEIRFEIPEWVEEDEEALKDYIVDNYEKFADALDYTANDHDDRAVVDEVRITHVDLGEDFVGISYEVDYSAYHGCRDMNYADTHERFVRGRREKREFVFKKFMHPPRRSTFEEF